MIPKFRFYNLKLNKIYEVVSVDWLNEQVDCILPEMNKDIANWDWNVGVLMQSTRLKDKHGVEIYEKDIVRDSYGDVFLIEWLDGGFVLTDFFSGGYDHCEIDDLESYEVIGNQFQHPHLLEE